MTNEEKLDIYKNNVKCSYKSFIEQLKIICETADYYDWHYAPFTPDNMPSGEKDRMIEVYDTLYNEVRTIRLWAIDPAKFNYGAWRYIKMPNTGRMVEV